MENIKILRSAGFYKALIFSGVVDPYNTLSSCLSIKLGPYHEAFLSWQTFLSWQALAMIPHPLFPSDELVVPWSTAPMNSAILQRVFTHSPSRGCSCGTTGRFTPVLIAILKPVSKANQRPIDRGY